MGQIAIIGGTGLTALDGLEITAEELVGSKVYKTRTGPNGRLFVLLGLDAAAAERIVAKAAKTSMKNEQALWQQFMAQKSFDEMAADIAKSEP